MTVSVLETDPDLVTGRWFDAGCGDGKGLGGLVQQVDPSFVVGADRSVWGLRLVRDGVPTMRGRVVQADVLSWPFADRSFDGVRAVHLIGHLAEADRPAAFAACARLLVPGGRLLVQEFGTGDFRFGKGDEVERGTFRRGVGIETHYFESDELHRLATGAGLEVDRLDAERFDVRYGGVERWRERWLLVARRPIEPNRIE